MITICEKEKCTGCGACMNVCPTNAVYMKENEYGFFSPEIDNAQCINCGLCEKTCPSNSTFKFEEESQCRSYAMYYKDKTITRESSSGGIFFALAMHVIEELQGIVFGAIYDEKKQVKVVSAAKTEELKAMMGSKYVYSDTGYTYREAKDYLEKGNYVLYSGLPCQISGLLNYLKKDYDKLITVEILCHGAPSQGLFNKYLDVTEKRYGSSVKSISQRDGGKDWNPLIQKRVRIEFEDGRELIQKEDADPYMSLFIRELSYNSSCYSCQYANKERRADITLGDYGGLGVFRKFENVNPNGVSFVQLNNLKAHEFVSGVKDVYMEERPSEEISFMNSAIVRPTKMPMQRNDFVEDYKKLEKEELFDKYYHKDYGYKIRCKIKGLIILCLGPKRVAKIIGGKR